ncbi:hypothetical protein BDV11DRAFT_201056 [Aspergillus similis]
MTISFHAGQTHGNNFVINTFLLPASILITFRLLYLFNQNTSQTLPQAYGWRMLILQLSVKEAQT